MSVDGDYMRAADDLAERCLAKFSDSEALPDLRAFALDIVVSQLAIGNRAMLAHVPDICRTLRDFAAGTQTITGTGAAGFYRQIIAALSVILDLPPTENHAGAWLEPVIDHFVELMFSCHDVETARLACEFCAQHADVFTDRVRMLKLLRAIMVRMIFDCDDVDPFPTKIRCQAAEKALESVFRFYISNSVPYKYIAFRLLLEKLIESDLWREKEAAIRALCAFTNARGECSV